ncbi:MFS transporter [Candidatus Sulfidibacterium hydrothermale]|uniref:MFS transporter n=1 Tax=Candidatus Sulfidibacterium hydrothermale TaxID=2875962 RepID=UPI001F0A40EB|nr:MFS transporter [Candidatus Sulfidibacterium hydrothermale]UBM62928.1 MFS transporter [Candidatus Sulfidibacterium hydrothermale]
MTKISTVFKKFPRTFWIANSMELFERWAWYGMFAVLALYLTLSRDTGALGFTQSQKGNMMGTVTAILYFLPLFTGALADRFGYKRMLLIAFVILSSSYLLMGSVKSYAAVYGAFLLVALGAAIFKPIVSATVAKTTDETTSSIGFGIFYMIVNIGGFVGPIFSSKLRHIYGWRIVFIMAASAIAVNILLALFFYKEPDRVKNTDSFWHSVKKSLINIFKALADMKLTVFLIIMIGFWTMFNQLFYTLPNFIEQWVDTHMIYQWLAGISPELARVVGTKDGTIAPEMMVNLDAGFIILFQILISSLVMRFKPVNAIISGIVVVSIGIGLAFATSNGFYVILGIFIFAIGEMASSPKFTEYIGRIAPKNKEALYMGTSFLPVAVGNYLAGIFSGPVYQSMSDKITLLEHEVAKRGLQIPAISKNFTQNDYLKRAAELMHTDQHGLTQMLWNTYHPYRIWVIFSTIGVITIIALFLYNKFVLGRAEKSNA